MVIDRDPSCAARALVSPRVHLEVASWNDWLAENLSARNALDYFVPYHWAPHVLLDWLTSDLEKRGLRLNRRPGRSAPPVSPPVLRETGGGDLAMSYAEWLCPPACIEPALCPHTRGPKSWSLATELSKARDSFVFPCLHLAYGVGAIPLGSIFEVRNQVAAAVEAGRGGPKSPLWVSTASHCHGLGSSLEGFSATRSGP